MSVIVLALHNERFICLYFSGGNVAAIWNCVAARVLVQLATNVSTNKTGKKKKQDNLKVT